MFVCFNFEKTKKKSSLLPPPQQKNNLSLETFRTLRNSGRRVFLATNSLWDYTDVVMRYLLGGGVNPTTGSPLWLDLFDVVVTGCGKPAFFKEARPLLEVDPATGLLRNTDSGTPMVPIGEADLPARGAGGGKGSADSTKAPSSSSSSPASAAAASSSSSSSFASGASTSTTHPSVQLASRRGPARVFQGGTYLDLHRRLGISSGAEVRFCFSRKRESGRARQRKEN